MSQQDSEAGAEARPMATPVTELANGHGFSASDVQKLQEAGYYVRTRAVC